MLGVEGAHKPGYDFVFQGLGGLMSINGNANEAGIEGGPQKVGIAIADILTGLDLIYYCP